MQTDHPQRASLLDQYVQHFAATIASSLNSPARPALHRINSELAAAPAPRPPRPRQSDLGQPPRRRSMDRSI